MNSLNTVATKRNGIVQGSNPSGQAQNVEVSANGGLIVGNALTKFRDSYESYVPGVLYNESKATGDIIQVDGNTASASYLVISKSNVDAGTESTLNSIGTFAMPLEASFGVHLSQRTLGQEFALEIVDTDTPIPTPAEIDISALSQATTTLTVTTATPHGLSVGFSFGIYGCTDSRFNYPSLVVATIVSETQFTATAGPGGTITSLTASPSVLGTPKVYTRRRLGGANDGTSIIFESANAINASFYVRSNSGDAFPSGTVAGNHGVTIASTASVALATSPLTYAFIPTSEYKLNMAIDRVQWHDQAVDVATGTTQRIIRTSVCPTASKQYRLRFRATNNKALTVPVGKIVSATKAGSTTATIVFAAAHGLTTNDQIVIYGIRDQTNFANLTTATLVASVVNSTTITIAFGASATATSYGGFVSRVNGAQIQQGVAAQAVQSASITNSVLTLTGSATWAGVSIGDYVDVYGIRDNTTGADVGVDGVYRVKNLLTVTLTLEPIAGTSIPTTLASVNAGGAVIKRTDFRISWSRIIDFERERVEFTPRPQADASAAIPVMLSGSTNVTASGITGNVAHDTAISGAPVRIAGRAISAAYTTVSTGDVADLVTTLQGVIVTRPWQIPELEWSYASAAGGVINTADVVLAAAAGTGLRRYITSMTLSNNSATATEVVLKDGATIIWRGHLPGNAGNVSISFQNPLKTTANAALNFACITTAAAVYVNAQGFTAA